MTYKSDYKGRWPTPLLLDQSDDIKALYARGLSTRQIAAKYGISKSYVHRLCSGLTRDRSSAARLRQPAKSKHWRTTRSVARRLMAWKLGRKLRRDEHVHHSNGDHTDNRPENLEVLSAEEHAAHHADKRRKWPKGMKPWQRPPIRAYMKEYLYHYYRRKKAERAAAGSKKC